MIMPPEASPRGPDRCVLVTSGNVDSGTEAGCLFAQRVIFF